MKARVIVNGNTWLLCEIKSEQMKEILADPEKKKLRGIPAYFDELGRVWPKPPRDMAVEFYDK